MWDLYVDLARQMLIAVAPFAGSLGAGVAIARGIEKRERRHG